MSFKVFGKWELEGITVEDPGLERYVSLKPVYLPFSAGRYAKKPFYKSNISIVERLINKLMVPGHKRKKHILSSGHLTGKKSHAYFVVKEAFEIIEKRTKQNPMKVFVKALENAAPRDEIITIEYGGARYPQAVECAPQRRVDLALRWFVQGAYSKSFRSKKRISEALADEIINAYNLSRNSNAITMKYDLERQADSAR